MRFAVPLFALAALNLAVPMGAQEATVAPAPAGQQDLGLTGPDAAELRILSDLDPTLRKAQAIVNGEVITDTDIDQRLNLVVAANGGKISEDERPRLRLQVLRNLIDEKLQVQEAASHDIKITDDEVERAYQRVSTNFKKGTGSFEDFLRGNGTSSSSIKAQIKGELAWSRLLRRRVEPLVNVGDDEVQSVMTKLNASKGQTEYHVGEIFMSATPESESTVMQDAGRIVGQIRAGASFVAYARQFSEASTAGLGGDLGWVRAEQLNDSVAPVVKALTPGNPQTGVSDPVKVPGGVAIMALIDTRTILSSDPNEAVLSLKQMSLPLAPETTEAQGREKVKMFQAATQAMGGCGRAEAVAKEIGAEIAANDSIRIKDLPAPLQTVIKQLSIGQATPPFGSAKDGLRVLVLCGRDDAPTQAKAPDFDTIYSQMNEERVNMRARRYLRDLRRDAIVDYR